VIFTGRWPRDPARLPLRIGDLENGAKASRQQPPRRRSAGVDLDMGLVCFLDLTHDRDR
jgi:hypothetical protein